jgi:hypothetical protein
MIFKQEYPWNSLNLQELVVIPICNCDTRHVYNGLRQYLINWYFDNTIIKTSNKPQSIPSPPYQYLFSNNTSNYQSTVHSFNHTAPLYIVITFIWTLSYIFYLTHARHIIVNKMTACGNWKKKKKSRFW